MNSLKEVLTAMAAHDGEKTAAAKTAAEAQPSTEMTADEALVKQAEDYDTIGRILAHSVFDDMAKEATAQAEAEQLTSKVASTKASILERMKNDPDYVQQLVAKHYGR